MSDTYISMMIESLEKKLKLLDRAIEIDKEQEELITQEDPDTKALDANIDAKGALVDELNTLDLGFENMYAKVREELINNKEAHKGEIRTLQELIRKITEKVAEVEAFEARSKINVENYLKRRRKKISGSRASAKAANSYALNMRSMGSGGSVFLDNKK